MFNRSKSVFASVLVCSSLPACHAAPAAEPTRRSAPPTTRPAPEGIRRTLIDRRPATDLAGWETRLYLIEFAPGAAAPLHTHPAVGIGFVLEGRFASAFGDEPVVETQAGQAFVDQAVLPHRVFRNPSTDRPLRFIVAYTLRSGDEPLHLLPEPRPDPR